MSIDEVAFGLHGVSITKRISRASSYLSKKRLDVT